MKRFFGFGKNKKKQKKRLSPSELSPAEGFHQATSPMYQYARNEFAQTVASGTSNDDGRGILYKSPSETPSRLFTRSEAELKQPSMVSNAPSGRSFNDSSWISPTTAQHESDHSSHFGSVHQEQDQYRPLASSTFESNQQAQGQTQAQPQVIGTSASLITSRSSSLIDNPATQQDQSITSRQRQGTATPGYQPPKYSTPHSTTHQQQTTDFNSTTNPGSPVSAAHTHATRVLDVPAANANIDPDYIAACSANNLGRQESLFSQASSQFPTNNSNQAPKSSTTYKNQYLEYPPSIEMPDATYEEEYGDAYIGGPIRYVYPSGYQSMRPRSGPWKLSIVICLLFTWLSVFIVGHCSDRVDSDVSQYNQNEIDDDTLVIETRWCGSRLLYMMWVISMLVTGLAAAYCSIIGYIKVSAWGLSVDNFAFSIETILLVWNQSYARGALGLVAATAAICLKEILLCMASCRHSKVRDFAVANSRSQPPGMAGKTDFYAQVDDAAPPPVLETSSQGSFSSSHHKNHYHVPIYQADGNPQFWGGHIYRPTQAAVAITSR